MSSARRLHEAGPARSRARATIWACAAGAPVASSRGRVLLRTPLFPLCSPNGLLTRASCTSVGRSGQCPVQRLTRAGSRVAQEVIRRRRAFLTAMAELLRRRRAIQAGMQVLPQQPTRGPGLSSGQGRVGWRQLCSAGCFQGLFFLPLGSRSARSLSYPPADVFLLLSGTVHGFRPSGSAAEQCAGCVGGQGGRGVAGPPARSLSQLLLLTGKLQG